MNGFPQPDARYTMVIVALTHPFALRVCATSHHRVRNTLVVQIMRSLLYELRFSAQFSVAWHVPVARDTPPDLTHNRARCDQLGLPSLGIIHGHPTTEPNPKHDVV